MKKLTTQLIKELSSLSEAIPSGFKGLFAKNSGLFWKNSDGTEKQIATADHKFHTFSNGEYYYDSYDQSKFFRLFMESSAFDNVRFKTPVNVEYHDGVSWVAWSGGDTLIKSLLDGRENTGFSLDHTHRRFRFEIDKASGWPITTLIVLQSVWTGAAYPGCSIKVENWDINSLSWVDRDIITFDSTTTSNNHGVHVKVNTSLHDGFVKSRITIEYNDWIDNGSYTYMSPRRFCMFSNYAGSLQYPFSWDFDQRLVNQGRVCSNEIINFDASIDPTQTGSSVTKTSTWMWQYLTQSIKWLKANFANYSLSTHNHALNNLSEKSYNSLTNKPAIPAAQTDTDWNSESSPNRLLNKYGFVEDYPESIQAFEGKVYLRIEDTWKFFPNLELVCVKSVKSDHGSYTPEFKEEFLTELIGRSTDMNLVFKAFKIEWYNYTGEEPTPSSYFKVSDFTALYYIIKPAFQYYYANNSNHFTIHIYDIVDKSTKCGDITFGNTAYGMLTHRLGSSVGINLFSNYSSLVSPFNSLGEWLLNYFFQIASPTADDSIITTRNTMKIGKQPKRTNSTWFRNFSGNMYDDVNNTVTSVSENTFICGDPILLCTTDSYTMAIETANVFGLLKYGQLGMSMVLVYPIQSVGGYKAFYYTPVGVDAVRIKDSNIQDTGHYDIMVSVYRKNKRKIEIMTNATEVVLNGVPSWRKYLTRNNDIWQHVRNYNATTKVTFCLVNTAIGYRTLESDRYLKMDRHVATIPWTLLPALKIKGD